VQFTIAASDAWPGSPSRPCGSDHCPFQRLYRLARVGQPILDPTDERERVMHRAVRTNPIAIVVAAVSTYPHPFRQLPVPTIVPHPWDDVSATQEFAESGVMARAYSEECS
jgi:hypothetical protein